MNDVYILVFKSLSEEVDAKKARCFLEEKLKWKPEKINNFLNGEYKIKVSGLDRASKYKKALKLSGILVDIRSGFHIDEVVKNSSQKPEEIREVNIEKDLEKKGLSIPEDYNKEERSIKNRVACLIKTSFLCYLKQFKKAFIFSGRSSRHDYWMFMAFSVFIYCSIYTFELIIEISIIYASVKAGLISSSDLVALGNYEYVDSQFVHVYDSIYENIILPTEAYIWIALIPTVSATIRRLHDTGKSGWWILAGVIPALILAVYEAQEDKIDATLDIK